MTRFGAAPTKFDADDLKPLTARMLASRPYGAVAEDIREAGVPDGIAEEFWSVVRENLETRADIAPWWHLFRDGPSPRVAEEDRDFVAEAMTLLPPHPYGPESWGAWTDAVKAATGRKGKQLFMPLRRAVTGQDRGPEMARVLPLFRVPLR